MDILWGDGVFSYWGVVVLKDLCIGVVMLGVWGVFQSRATFPCLLTTNLVVVGAGPQVVPCSLLRFGYGDVPGGQPHLLFPFQHQVQQVVIFTIPGVIHVVTPCVGCCCCHDVTRLRDLLLFLGTLGTRIFSVECSGSYLNNNPWDSASIELSLRVHDYVCCGGFNPCCLLYLSGERFVVGP